MSTRAQPSFWLSPAAFSSSLSVIFSHTVTAISAGEKQAVFSDIISAARSEKWSLRLICRPSACPHWRACSSQLSVCADDISVCRLAPRYRIAVRKTFIAHFAAQRCSASRCKISRSGTFFLNGTFSTIAPVGQRDTHCPHEIHCEFPSDL